MKILIIALLSLLFLSLSCSKPIEIEHDVFIAFASRNFDSSGKLILKDTTNVIKFSTGFWNYFIRTHPKSSSIIFVSPLYDPNNNYISLNDTSYTFYNPNFSHSLFFEKLLAGNANEKEKENPFESGFFVIPNDTIGSGERGKKNEERLKEYTITPLISKEFEQLKNILTLKDNSQHFIIIFKKNFANRIFKLYE